MNKFKKYKKGHVLTEEESEKINNAFSMISELAVKFNLNLVFDKKQWMNIFFIVVHNGLENGSFSLKKIIATQILIKK